MGRHFLLKDKLSDWDGRPARLEIAVDITEQEPVSYTHLKQKVVVVRRKGRAAVAQKDIQKTVLNLFIDSRQ